MPTHLTLGGEIQQATGSTSYGSAQYDHSILGLSNGKYIVAITDYNASALGATDESVLGYVYGPIQSNIGVYPSSISTVQSGYYNMNSASLVADDDGGFYIAYVAEDGTAPGKRIVVEHRDSSSQVIASTIVQLEPTSAVVSQPSIARNASGQIFVAYQWDDSATDEIRGKLLDANLNILTTAADGLVIGADGDTSNFVIGAYDPNAVALSDGSFAVAFEDYTSTTNSLIRVRRYDPVTDLVNTAATGTYSLDRESDPEIAVLEGGGYVFVWVDNDGSSDAIRYAVRDNPATTVVLNGTVANHATDNFAEPDVVALKNGGFAISYRNTTTQQVFVQFYAESGSLDGLFEIPFGQNFKFDLATDGRLLASYESYTGDIYSVILDYRDNVIVADGTEGVIAARFDASSTITGSAADETILGQSRTDSIFGGDGNDSIVGNSGDDTLSGGFGNDTIIGGTQFDWVDYSYSGPGNGQPVGWWDINLTTGVAVRTTAGGVQETDQVSQVQRVIGSGWNDTITGNDSWNRIEGGGGDDLLYVSDNNNTYSTSYDTLYGDAGEDTLVGGGDRAVLYGGTQDDLFIHLDGDLIDRIDGGTGTDTLDASAETTHGITLDLTAETWTGLGGTEVIRDIEEVRGTGAADDLTGNSYGTTLKGNNGNDILRAGGAGDNLQGGWGLDTIYGGDGLDTINGDQNNDLIVHSDGQMIDILNGGTGTDTLDASAETTFGLKLDLTAQTWTGQGGSRLIVNIEEVRGTQSNDLLVGNTYGSTLRGNAGDDELYAGGAGDLLEGGDGDDTLYGSALDDTIYGGANNDLIFFGDGDRIDGVDGGTGIDTLDISQEGIHAVTVNLETEVWSGNGGSRFIRGIEVFRGTRADDDITASDDGSTLRGERGEDSLRGGSGADSLDGGIDNDLLLGNAGNDTLRGGAGNDTMNGGSDADLVVYSGKRDEFALSRDASGTVFVEDLNLANGDEGLDELTGIERIRFADDEIITASIADRSFGETGVVSMTDAALTVTLQRSYDNPVALAFVMTENGVQPVNARITDVTGDQLTMFLQEPNNEDGIHGVESVAYMIVEEGSWELPDGRLLEAGLLNSNKLSPSGFESVTFATEFGATPVVFSQVQSFNGSDFVTTRQRASDSDGFELTMQEEEAGNGGVHATETLGWVALDAGTSNIAGFQLSAWQAGGVTDATTTLNTPVAHESPVDFIANLSSFRGADPVWARGTASTNSSVSLSAEEDDSSDSETLHNRAETANVMAFDGSRTLAQVARQTILETGTVTLTSNGQQIALKRAFENPVALAFVMSENGVQPVNVRITDVASDTLTMFLQEPNNEDGIHGAEDVAYVVIEAGNWVLPDGTLVEAGLFNSNQLSSSGFEDVAFTTAFDAPPVVLSQVQSYNGVDFVVTHQNRTSANSFSVAMEEEEAGNSGYHTTESIGWFAIEAGSGSIGGFDWIAGNANGVTHADHTIALPGTFSGPVDYVAGLTSKNGNDSAWARGSSTTPGSITLSVEEDTSSDAETSHVAPEQIDYFAFEGSNVVEALPLSHVMETGSVSLAHSSSTVTLQRSYENPVAMAFVMSENGAAPVTARITQVAGNQLTIFLQEPGNEDGIHAAEDVAFVVVESGSWVLEDGKRLQADTFQTSLLTSAGFADVTYTSSFDEAPVVLSQVQTNNGADFVTTRQRDATVNGVRLALQEEEAQNAGKHALETVGWIAIEQGSGQIGDFEWIAGRVGNVTDTGGGPLWAQGLSDDAEFVASLSTFNGADPAWARGSGATMNSLTLSVEEDTSADAETTHIGEDVDYFAFATASTVSGYDVNLFV
ncbi:hypothetical protein VK792_12490 [Mesobacterium sp. TK19101]|uniref:Uncharacterized protein n=1 Tax=Mesobacterium hydrothermale TaxID=3111907 RepID=A0ABU6HJP3_9RHOB|nr:hypothetical protein [Mesobacterium sp. TK19101]MEC3862104.1 hypothetical protein [Mesobacterium sp. TK19101]